jgi:hypothetical protein
MPFSKSFILIPVCITVSKAFWKSTKQANTLPSLLIHKGNDPSDPNNYRGIAKTNSLGKLFNRILDNRLTKFLDKYHVINDSQMGFILIPVCITVSKAFWKSTKQANTLPSLLLQFYQLWSSG